MCASLFFFFFQAEDGIRYPCVTGVQTCALPISRLANLLGAPETGAALAVVEGRKLALEIGSQGRAGFRGAEQVRKSSDRGDDGVKSMRISGVRRDSDFREGLDSFEAVQIFSDQHKVRMQGSDGFQAGIDGAADFRFLLRPGRKIAVIGVSDEAGLAGRGGGCLRGG